MNEITKRTDLNITIFSSDAFGDIRVTGTPDEPLFCLADVCRVLDLQPSRIKDRLDERGVTKSNTPTKNQHGAVVVQPLTYVNERNFYQIIMRSNKRQVKPFQDWVFGEVLPQIRKTGGYIPVSADDTAETIAAKTKMVAELTTELVEKNRQLSAYESEVKMLREDNQAKSRDLAVKNSLLSVKDLEISRKDYALWVKDNENAYLRGYKESAEPKLAEYEKWVDATGLYTVTQIAKEVGVAPHELNKALEKVGWLKKIGSTWLPTKKFDDLNERNKCKMFALKNDTYSRNGVVCSRQRIYYTHQFKNYLVRKYGKVKPEAV